MSPSVHPDDRLPVDTRGTEPPLSGATPLPPSVAVAGVIDGKNKAFDPLDPSLQPPVRMQAQPAIAWRLVADVEIFAARRELDAGGRRGQQAHAVALAVDFLVYMPPEHGPDLGKTVQDGKQRLGVAQADGGRSEEHTSE